MRRLKTTIAMSAVAAAIFYAAGSMPALAQATLNEAIGARAQAGSGQDRLLVDAKEIVYDNDRNTIAAAGDVQMNYQGRTLQADRVTYDRNTGRVFAEGNARLTDANGTVATGDRFELTDDFKSGFIDSLRVVQTSVEQGRPLTTRFSAPRAERAEGETTTFERGTYTACESCKDNPERPPLWQVKAAKIIHNNSERTIYYEDATLELLGIPVAYLPYFWTPDPTVKRKTGFLSPRYIYSSSIGYGASVPFFWAIAPNYDLTIAPAFLSRQGVLGQVEWRHRLENGTYNVRAAGISQREPEAFLASPYGAGNRDFRGSLETTGLFYINQNWRWGWDIALLSDKWFLSNYKIRSESLSSYYVKESISTLFLQGQGDRSYFDVRGYYFQTLSSNDWQKQQPIVAPVLDYNKRFTPPTVGGEFALDVNVTSLSREAAQYDPLSVANTTYFGVAQTCIIFDRASCLVRGISGSTSRASVTASWRREFVDPIGQVWTPFAYVRADNFWIAPDFNGYQNPQLANFIDGEDDYLFRVMPAVGVEYRFPFIGSIGTSGQQILEPIAQVIARPNETRVGRLPNEDAQSLVFDDTSLFDWDKFSGYDRVEGGVRANIGVQYTVTGADDFYANVLFGQSHQLAGRNSFRQPDLANVGLESGLDTRASDYVGRFQIAPNANFALVTRARFDDEDFDLNRFEAGVRANFNPYLPVSTSLTYARYEAQPAIGFPLRREGLLGSARWDISPNWYVTGSVLLDLDRYLLARETFATQYAINPATAIYDQDSVAYVSGLSFGLGYMDECTTFSLVYSVTPREVTQTSGEKNQNHTIAFSLEFRSLGEVGYSQNLSGTSDE
ncbi:organic solvent tolerance protein [Microvirga ossetica]|uniref:LPS-assembly protein LptD n=1 Tax=Microvirga ossetica TaxID=1882682 RepID=A0A1B2EL37_9HYPH|nr:LPS-assembly protein LptD [Microvirga ossetica]ANY80696.1 organic solvent tolerance protein [Microvirga ossetica]